MSDFFCRIPSFETPLRYVSLATRRNGLPEYQLTEEFAFEIGGWGSKTFIAVPIGFVTDLASIPWGFRWILPPDGPYAKAAVIHDFMYENAGHVGWSRGYCDLIFLDGMRTLSVARLVRLIMYAAVRVFGARNFKKVIRAC
jgi:hypothetical protein